ARRSRVGSNWVSGMARLCDSLWLLGKPRLTFGSHAPYGNQSSRSHVQPRPIRAECDVLNASTVVACQRRFIPLRQLSDIPEPDGSTAVARQQAAIRREGGDFGRNIGDFCAGGHIPEAVVGQ